MSYVLEALKKREAEEDPDAAVALSLNAERQRRHRRLAGLLWIALIVNVCVLAGVLLWVGLPLESWRETPTDARGWEPAAGSGHPAAAGTAPDPKTRQMPAPEGPSAESPAPVTEGQPLAPQSAASAPTPASDPAATRAQPSPRADAPAPASRRPAPPASPVPLNAVPDAVRSRMPGIVFSTHIYADDTDLRAVVANGQRLTEGDRLGQVRIREITETGVILDFEGYLIAVPVVGFWDTP